jgi:hypothetical protein
VVEHRRDGHRTPNGTEQAFTWVGMVWRPKFQPRPRG